MKKSLANSFPKTVSLETLAGWSDFSERHLRDLSDSGKLPPIERGEISLQAIPALFKYLRRDSEELVREKLKKVIADRRISEVEARVAEGKFKSVEVFNSHLIALGVAINCALNGCEKDLKNGDAPEAAADALRAKVANALLEAKIDESTHSEDEPG